VCIVSPHLVEVGDGVVRARYVAHYFAGRDSDRAEHDGERCGYLLAKSHPVPEEELVHGVGTRRQGRYVHGIVRVRADPIDQRLHPGVGRAIVSGDGPGQSLYPRIGMGELEVRLLG
jgi:hypothetical protein